MWCCKVQVSQSTEGDPRMPRPIVQLTATKHGQDKVFVSISSTKVFGTICLPVEIFEAFTNTLLTGSLASGSEGCEIKLVEERQ